MCPASPAEGRRGGLLESPGQSGASQAADRGGQAGCPTRKPEGDPGEPRGILRWGRYRASAGVLMVLATALLGAVFTVASHRDPGRTLAIFVIAGTVAAGIGVRARSAYAIIPVPALAYAAAAVIAGFIHDRPVGVSRSALALSAAQSLASGFTAMIAATALAVLIAVARRLLSTLRERRRPNTGRS
jgi:hypothetical protein